MSASEGVVADRLAVDSIQRPHSGVARLYREMIVPQTVTDTFAFFADARNLNALTPPWLAFKILTPTPIEMHQGTLIDYQIRIRGVRVKWRTEITLWSPPHAFTDVQIRGPYRWWHHEHRFEPADNGRATRVIDEVEYLAPFARIIHPLMVTRDVESIFDYRAQRMAAIFGQTEEAVLRVTTANGPR